MLQEGINADLFHFFDFDTRIEFNFILIALSVGFINCCLGSEMVARTSLELRVTGGSKDLDIIGAQRQAFVYKPSV